MQLGLSFGVPPKKQNNSGSIPLDEGSISSAYMISPPFHFDFWEYIVSHIVCDFFEIPEFKCSTSSFDFCYISEFMGSNQPGLQPITQPNPGDPPQPLHAAPQGDPPRAQSPFITRLSGTDASITFAYMISPPFTSSMRFSTPC